MSCFNHCANTTAEYYGIYCIVKCRGSVLMIVADQLWCSCLKGQIQLLSGQNLDLKPEFESHGLVPTKTLLSGRHHNQVLPSVLFLTSQRAIVTSCAVVPEALWKEEASKRNQGITSSFKGRSLPGQKCSLRSGLGKVKVEWAECVI